MQPPPHVRHPLVSESAHPSSWRDDQPRQPRRVRSSTTISPSRVALTRASPAAPPPCSWTLLYKTAPRRSSCFKRAARAACAQPANTAHTRLHTRSPAPSSRPPAQRPSSSWLSARLSAPLPLLATPGPQDSPSASRMVGGFKIPLDVSAVGRIGAGGAGERGQISRSSRNAPGASSTPTPQGQRQP